MLQERDARRPRADVDAQRPASPARSPATAAWDVTDKPAVSGGPADAAAEVTSMSARADSATAPWARRDPLVCMGHLSSHTKMALLGRSAAIPLQQMEVMRHKHLQKDSGRHKRRGGGQLSEERQGYLALLRAN